MIDIRTIRAARTMLRAAFGLAETAKTLSVSPSDLDRALWHWIGQK